MAKSLRDSFDPRGAKKGHSHDHGGSNHVCAMTAMHTGMGYADLDELMKVRQ